MWESIVLDARRQWFPNNGKAAIFEKDFPSAKVGRLWLFHPERNTLLQDSYAHGYSYYLVSGNLEPVPLVQVINWTSRVNSSVDLPGLLEQGIDQRSLGPIAQGLVHEVLRDTALSVSFGPCSDRKSTRLNSSHYALSRMPSSA